MNGKGFAVGQAHVPRMAWNGKQFATGQRYRRRSNLATQVEQLAAVFTTLGQQIAEALGPRHQG